MPTLRSMLSVRLKLCRVNKIVITFNAYRLNSFRCPGSASIDVIVSSFSLSRIT
jgi:hypothetical protein